MSSITLILKDPFNESYLFELNWFIINLYMKRKIFLVVVVICAVILLTQLGSQQLAVIFNLQSRSGLKITATPEAAVFINGLEIGKTPFEDDNLNVGEYLVKLTNENSSWQGKIQLTKGTLSIINRMLAPSIASSSGESLVLDTGKGTVITSSPSNSGVEVDGKIYGKTPLSLSDLPSGEHDFNISHEGYVKRHISVSLPRSTSLHINVDLALVEISSSQAPTPTVAITQKVKIKQTTLGYLRVREKPSVNSKEVGQVSVGDEFIKLEEVPGWVKIRLGNSQEGYVAVSYTEIISQ